MLQDSILWGALSKFLEEQITTLNELQECYKNPRWTVLHEQAKDESEKQRNNKKSKNGIFRNGIFAKNMDSLAKDVLRKFTILTKVSQDLIQLVK